MAVRVFLWLQKELIPTVDAAAIATHYQQGMRNVNELRGQTRLAADLLTADLQNPPSVDEICQQVGLSEFKLKKGFKLHFNTTVGAYLRAARMDKAMELLKTENTTISSIANELGYANPSRFAEAFRKHHGKNPSDIIQN